MNGWTLFIISSSFIILYYSAVTSAQVTELTSWSQWTCFNGTIASRNRTTQICTGVEYIDPVTNMTMTNTSCDNVTEIDRRTDVVSANTWTNWAPMVQCSTTGTITQNRNSSCQTADFECSSICTGGRTTERTTTVPLCCAQQNYSEWTTWAPGCSPSDPVSQTRQRVVLPCDQNIQCEPNCSDITEMRIIAQTSWGMWGLWSSMEVPMCGAGVRSRQRVCTNTTLVYCDIDCTFGTNDTDNQCCVVSNVWSTWTSWSQATNSGPCPDTRTRTRSCVANTTVTDMYPGQPDCDGTCTLTTEEPQTQGILTSRCVPPSTIITELTPWSQWTCFNGTIASRNRTVQRCADMEDIDPVTNMTMTNTLCDNLTAIDRRADVVSANTWTNWAPMAQCGATGTITQNHTSSCQPAVFECSSICTGGRTTQRTIAVPLCCAQQNYSDWTTWTPGCSPSDLVSQTRQRVVLPCDQNIQCEPNCSDITEIRIIAQTSWGMWGLWSSMEVPMCGAGVRSRQRVCTNTTLVYCDIDCTFGTNDTDNQCCVVSNVWSTWTSWSQATNSGPCPDNRTRTRSCVANTTVTDMYPGQPDCDGTCTLTTEEPQTQKILTSRCEAPPAIITELTPWSQWTCFNDTVASRNRTVQRCADMEDIDPVTNMTMTNTLCDDLIDIERRIDVVSANTWSSWVPIVQCSTTGTITQNRTSSCQTADFQCSSICTGGRATQRTTTVPLCCAQQTYSEWTTWVPGCSPSDPVSQTRQRVVLPCDQNIQCETDCPNITQMRIIAQTSWGMWGLWNSTEVPMCGAGVRSRQRVCTNTTLVYCDIDCTFGTNDTDNQCCVVSNVWSTWTSWSQATNSGPCPDTRTRTRSCVANTTVTDMYPGQPDCDGTCTLTIEEPQTQKILTSRCEAPPAIITELTPWSQWTCFMDTVASRNRTVQRCTDMEDIDPVTNMTMTNTLCDNLIDIMRRTDVVSANTWSSWAPIVQCSTTGTITQNRTSSCQTAVFECSSICTGGRATQRTTTVPLCCAQQTYSEWTTWAPGCSPSDPVSQTRQQVVLPCDQNIQCETDCPNITQMRIIAQTSWGMWGLWSSMEVPMCGAGVRSRQRVCTNTTLVYCDIDCTFGTNDTDNQCCVVRNVWSTWTDWSQATNSGPCPDTRTRTRSCVADTNMTGQPDCDGTCTLNKEQPERQQVATRRCDEIGNLATSTGDDNEFPTWAIGLISAIVVILVVAGFVAITIGGRCLTRRRAYYIEEVTAATQKEYNKMNEGVPPSTYQPTTSFTEGIPGTTATDSNNFIEPFEENPL